MPDVGSRILKQRLSLGMTQRELASLVGISTRMVEAIEQGTDQPTPAQLAALADALGLKLTSLEPTNDPPDLRETVEGVVAELVAGLKQRAASAAKVRDEQKRGSTAAARNHGKQQAYTHAAELLDQALDQHPVEDYECPECGKRLAKGEGCTHSDHVTHYAVPVEISAEDRYTREQLLSHEFIEAFRQAEAEAMGGCPEAMETETFIEAALASTQPEGEAGKCPNAHRYVEGVKQPCPDCQGTGTTPPTRDELGREIPEAYDASGERLLPGTDLGDGERVTEIREGDEGESPSVATNCDTWPTRPRDYRREGPAGPYVWVCDDVSVVPPTQEREETRDGE